MDENQFIGEIRMFAGTRAPTGWAFCDGKLLGIAQNSALFALLGDRYGGDGQRNFALPDLRGRLPLHQGQGPGLSRYWAGQRGGSEQAALYAAQLPPHSHAWPATRERAAPAHGTSGVLGDTGGAPTYGLAGGATTAMQLIDPAGGSQPHENMPPYLCINFIIALTGVYPPHS